MSRKSQRKIRRSIHKASNRKSRREQRAISSELVAAAFAAKATDPCRTLVEAIAARTSDPREWIHGRSTFSEFCDGLDLSRECAMEVILNSAHFLAQRPDLASQRYIVRFYAVIPDDGDPFYLVYTLHEDTPLYEVDIILDQYLDDSV